MNLPSRLALVGVAWLAFAPAVWSAETWWERCDWAQFLDEAGVAGTIVVVDERGTARSNWVHGEARARTRYLPASRFKAPHDLFALDAGVIRNEFQAFRWDGTRHDIESWNRDQDLRSSMRNSTVWVYPQFVREIGEKRERRYLRISAEEQVSFLRRLYRNELPFRIEPQVGWWLGWVERPEGPVFFALNIGMPNGAADLLKREGIARPLVSLARPVGVVAMLSNPGVPGSPSWSRSHKTKGPARAGPLFLWLGD